MSAAAEALQAGMVACPDEFKGDMDLKTVWLAGFMRGYRHKQEDPEWDEACDEERNAYYAAVVNEIGRGA